MLEINIREISNQRSIVINPVIHVFPGNILRLEDDNNYLVVDAFCGYFNWQLVDLTTFKVVDIIPEVPDNIYFKVANSFGVQKKVLKIKNIYTVDKIMTNMCY